MAYTQTLLPKWTHNRSLQQQFLDLKYMIQEYLNKFAARYELWFELHESGNLHCHGIVTIKDNIKRCKLLWQMTQKIGNVKWKEIDDYHKWREYCEKDSRLMAKVLDHKMPLVVDNTHTKEISWFDDRRMTAKMVHEVSYGDVVDPLPPPSDSEV